MARPSILLWFALIGIVLLPTAAGRLFLDIAGGLMLAFLALPILLTGVGWLGWRFLQARLIKCEFCGTSILKGSFQCPACGSTLSKNKENHNSASTVIESIPASSATIDITAKASGEEHESS